MAAKTKEKVFAPSGWCIDQLHKRCSEFYFGKWEEHDCNCECHKEEES